MNLLYIKHMCSQKLFTLFFASSLEEEDIKTSMFPHEL
jgi:hypothetical protein